MSKSQKKQAASIVWFGIPADNPERAKMFYSNLFGWKIDPVPGANDYWYIDTPVPTTRRMADLRNANVPKSRSRTT
jgi:predicted enzyme related to lactoylglutathione lyase